LAIHVFYSVFTFWFLLDSFVLGGSLTLTFELPCSSGFKHDEQHRPEFRGTAMPSIVTGRTTLFFDEGKKRRAIIISVVGIATMVVGLKIQT
jgi:hypothetical protein